ncbi:MAG: hypothetical protein GY730_09670 [bacterium]|nr:hypothetical protein [bacterium]
MKRVKIITTLSLFIVFLVITGFQCQAAQKVVSKSQKKNLLKKSYEDYKKIPLLDRMDRDSSAVQQWENQCQKISLNYLDCKAEKPGNLIYKESYEKYLNDPAAKAKQYQECLSFEKAYKEKNEYGVFNKRPRFDLTGMEGTNECHAVFDVLEAQLTKKYMAMTLEERVKEMMRCQKSKTNDICDNSLRAVNKKLAKKYKEMFQNDNDAKKLQTRECSELKNKLLEIDTEYTYVIRKAGECKAVNFW